MIKSLEIKGLYYLYNYKLDNLDRDQVRIITGPNGYGKTTLLNIIFNLLNCNLWFFNFLIFKELIVVFSDSCKIKIIKNTDSSDSSTDNDFSPSYNDVHVEFSLSDQQVESFDITKQYVFRLYRRLSMIHGLERNVNTDDIKGLLTEYYSYNNDTTLPSSSRNACLYLRGQGCSFLRSERLLAPNSSIRMSRYSESKDVIKKVENDIKSLYFQQLSLYGRRSREIDKSFIDRLTSDNKDTSNLLTKKEYLEEAAKLNGQIIRLQNFGLAMDLKVSTNYKSEYRPVLTLYLKDVKEKINILGDFYKKLSLFDSFISKKTLSHKTMRLDPDLGISFNDDIGNPVPLSGLSDGEKSLVVLYYNLIFNSQANSVILIDEPEKSMHVEWVSNVLNDYIEMSKILNCQIIFATHSPTFINGNWDLTSDLFEMNGNK